jgi:DNA polymerase III subunit gamma/tau
MSYLVLARKFRPQRFDAVLGQDHISRALIRSIYQNRVPHAVLLSGPRGVGKTTTARILARALNCTGRNKSLEEIQKLSRDEAMIALEPCGVCTHCVEIARSSSLAVWEMDGASNNSVENIRDVIDSLRTPPPPGANYKIYIIDEVHMLSTAAFNALLKSLEEPPPQTVFIFATTDPQKIPETVLSRCQRFDFRKLDQSLIVQSLQEILRTEKVEIPHDVVTFIARRSQGGMRDAQSMLDRVLALADETTELSDIYEIFGAIDRGGFLQLARTILDSNHEAALNLLDTFFSRSIDIRSLVTDFLEMWRELLHVNTPKISLATIQKILERSEGEVRELQEISSGKEYFDFQRLFEVAERVCHLTLQSPMPRYTFEAGVVRMATLPDLKPLGEIFSQLHSNDLNLPGSSLNRSSGVTNGGSGKQIDLGKNPRGKEGSSNGENLLGVVSTKVHWSEFVTLSRERGELVLSEIFRRVVVGRFEEGRIEIEASAFDLGMLKDPDNHTKLQKTLEAYRPGVKWTIQFIEKKNESTQKSLAQVEAEQVRQDRERRENDVRTDPLVKDVLDAFQGSVIERISFQK